MHALFGNVMEPLLSMPNFYGSLFFSVQRRMCMDGDDTAGCCWFLAVYVLCSRLLYGFVIAASTVDFTKYELEKQMT